MSRGRWAVAALLVACLASSGRAEAQEGARTLDGATDGRVDDEARSLFQAGSVAYDQGRFENALDYFRRAHALSGRSALLYNIALAAEQLRHDDEALEAFRAFLAAQPDAPQRPSIEARIAVIERAQRERAQRERAHAAATSDTTRGPDLAGPVALLVSGGLLALGGGALLGVAAADVAAVEGAPRGASWASVSDAYGRSEALSVTGGVSLGVGGALAVVGALWLAVGTSTERSPRPETTLSLRVGPGTLAVAGSW